MSSWLFVAGMKGGHFPGWQFCFTSRSWIFTTALASSTDVSSCRIFSILEELGCVHWLDSWVVILMPLSVGWDSQSLLVSGGHASDTFRWSLAAHQGVQDSRCSEPAFVNAHLTLSHCYLVLGTVCKGFWPEATTQRLGCKPFCYFISLTLILSFCWFNFP